MLGVKGAGGGGGDGTRGRDAFDGEHNDVGGTVERGRGDDGDKHPASSLSISLSNFTSPGGSTPNLREVSQIYTVTATVTMNNETEVWEHFCFVL